jgi:hypothetical protein
MLVESGDAFDFNGTCPISRSKSYAKTKNLCVVRVSQVVGTKFFLNLQQAASNSGTAICCL